MLNSMKPLMPFAVVALGLFGLITFANLASNHAVASNKARWDAARAAVEHEQQVARDKAQVQLQLAEKRTAEEAALVHQVIAQARKELTAGQ